MAVDISKFVSLAQEQERKYGIPTSITLAQLIQESSGRFEGGLSGLAFHAKNLFGVKGTGSAGTYYATTTEFVNGKYVSTQAGFRKYNSYEESLTDHSKVLLNERYTKHTSKATTLAEYAQGISKGGYATDPTYASSLVALIKQNKLDQYDINKKPVGGADNNKLPSHMQDGFQGFNEFDKDHNMPDHYKDSFGGDTLETGSSMLSSITKIVVIILVALVSVAFFMQAFDIRLKGGI